MTKILDIDNKQWIKMFLVKSNQSFMSKILTNMTETTS